MRTLTSGGHNNTACLDSVRYEGDLLLFARAEAEHNPTFHLKKTPVSCGELLTVL
jgi:hypothetical protein